MVLADHLRVICRGVESWREPWGVNRPAAESRARPIPSFHAMHCKSSLSWSQKGGNVWLVNLGRIPTRLEKVSPATRYIAMLCIGCIPFI